MAMRLFITLLSICGLALAAGAGTDATAKPVTFIVDGATTKPISPYIYGVNFPDWSKHKYVTLCRWGGNRTTAYNWETNASNAGNDWQHQNDDYLSRSDAPADPVLKMVQAAQAAGAASIVTVPCAGYVSADKNGDGDVNKTPDYLNKRFVVSLPRKGAPFADKPDLTDHSVYQDEFVHFIEAACPQARKDPARTIFYALDNEPDLWSSTHARIHPKPTTYEELVKVNTDYAMAIKAVAPKAMVLGFASYGWDGFTSLQHAPDANKRDFLEFYLAQMRQAQKQAGKRLIDAVDLHWYPEARGGNVRISEDDSSPAVAAARVQAPRSLWDPAYTEDSWITRDWLHQPIRLIPRVLAKIAKNYPGTKLALAEYYYGGGDHISGALAEADALGIFGREGVFAAAMWHCGKTDDRFIHAAFAMYRNYDGKGGIFGQSSLGAQTDDVENTSLYASKDARGSVVLVAINKSGQDRPAVIKFKNCPAGKRVAVFRLTSAGAHPVSDRDLAVVDGLLAAQLPAQSVSTLVIEPSSPGIGKKTR